jgi:DNA repair exonuclease SbcCD ATPase subunit
MSDDDAKSAIGREFAAVLARKSEGRREISRRTFGEKIAMMEALRERLAPLKRERERRRTAREARVASSSAHTEGGGETEGPVSATSPGSNT